MQKTLVLLFTLVALIFAQVAPPHFPAYSYNFVIKNRVNGTLNSEYGGGLIVDTEAQRASLVFTFENIGFQQALLLGNMQYIVTGNAETQEYKCESSEVPNPRHIMAEADVLGQLEKLTKWKSMGIANSPDGTPMSANMFVNATETTPELKLAYFTCEKNHPLIYMHYALAGQDEPMPFSDSTTIHNFATTVQESDFKLLAVDPSQCVPTDNKDKMAFVWPSWNKPIVAK